MESWPYVGGVFAFVYFIGFALRTPMHSKLVKESGMSLMMGMATAAFYPWYYKRIYDTNVHTVYNDLRKAIKLNPKLAKPDDDTAINKNFGPSKWNTAESGMESDDEIEEDNATGFYEGDPEGDTKDRRKAMMAGL